MALDRRDGSFTVPKRREVGAGTPAADPVDCRCACGSLVARLVSGGVELKCRRCKRTLVVPLQARGVAEPVRAESCS